jgi:hypothetical protein
MRRADIERSRDSRAEVEQEALLTARGERRLVEHELTRRRVLLALTVAFTIGGFASALFGQPYAAAAFTGGAVASANATASRPGG